MSTKHVRTAGDLIRFRCALKVECGRCGNSLTLSGYEVARGCRSDINLQALQRRLKCSLCGAKEGRLTVLSPPALGTSEQRGLARKLLLTPVKLTAIENPNSSAIVSFSDLPLWRGSEWGNRSPATSILRVSGQPN